MSAPLDINHARNVVHASRNGGTMGTPAKVRNEFETVLDAIEQHIAERTRRTPEQIVDALIAQGGIPFGTRQAMIVAARAAQTPAATMPQAESAMKLPMPNDEYDGGIVVASCATLDPDDSDFDLLLLNPDNSNGFYRVVTVNAGKIVGDEPFPNIIPAAHFYSDQIGGY